MSDLFRRSLAPRVRLPLGGNLLLNPLLDGTWSAVASTITARVARSPNGEPNATTIIENGASSTHEARQTISKAASPIAYRYSFYGRSQVGTRGISFAVFDGDFSSGCWGGVNFLTGAVGDTPGSYGSIATPVMTFKRLGRGWYWMQLAFTSGSHAQLILGVAMLNPGTGTNYAGDSASSVVAWGTELRAA